MDAGVSLENEHAGTTLVNLPAVLIKPNQSPRSAKACIFEQALSDLAKCGLLFYTKDYF
jgi:hypothetical protein